MVNAGAAVPAEPSAREEELRQWVGHMLSCRIVQSEGCEDLERWGEEDTHFPLEDELEAVEAAGFFADCVWQQGPMTAVVGRKRA